MPENPYEDNTPPHADAGRICGLIGTILSSLMLLLIAAYQVFIVWIFSTSMNNHNSGGFGPGTPNPSPTGTPTSPKPTTPGSPL